MSNESNRTWVLKERPTGLVGEEHFRRDDRAIPSPKEGEIVVRMLILSFDASQRIYTVADSYIPKVEIGDPMRSLGLGQVVDSKHSKYKAGDLVMGMFAWQDYVLVDPATALLPPNVVPALVDPALMLALSLTGLTGYFGMLKVGQPKAGETVVVSGAAGATGSVAAQVARIYGGRVIGIAGGADKCRFLKETLKLDDAIDYKHEDVGKRLKELCPRGIDVYFDNVGGEITEHVLGTLADGARIVLCGAISQYSLGPDAFRRSGTPNYLNLIMHGARIEGFMVTKFMPQMMTGIIDLTRWVEKGKLVQAIDMKEGFENIPKTLSRLFTGANIGKQLLKLADPPIPIQSSLLQRAFFKVAQTIRGIIAR